MTDGQRLSILIPTAGRETLARAVQSVVWQMRQGDELILAGDTYDGPLPGVERVAAGLGALGRYVPVDAGHHCWGHHQVSEAQRQARGDYLVFNDDDDVFHETALASIRAAIAALDRPRPLLFRFLSQYRLLLPMVELVTIGNVGGHCLVVPNVQKLMADWPCEYQGDFLFVRDTLALWSAAGVEPVWRQEVIAIARPTDAPRRASREPAVAAGRRTG